MELKQNSLNLEYCRASMAKRFANYITDAIVVYILLFLLGFILESISPGLISKLNISSVSERVIGIVFYWFVMFFTEFTSQGKSIGKLITGTKAINNDGSKLSLGKSFIRNFIRAIPFNALSAFGSPCNPWHDSWSQTLVVDEKVLNLQERKNVFYKELKNQTQ